MTKYGGLFSIFLLCLARTCSAAAPAPASPAPLRYWFWWPASSFDTYKGDYFDVMQAARNIYAPLVSIGLDGRPQGMVAEDWKVDVSGRTWRFRLRKGLAFDDGVPITPEVALKNFRRMLWLTRAENLPLNSLMPEVKTWSDPAAPLSSLYTEGENLVFHFKRRPNDLFEILSHPVYGIASPRCFGADGVWKDAYCYSASGQYRVAERGPGLIRLVSRHVFPALAAAPEAVEIRTPVKPGESALKAVLAGEGDLAIEPSFALSGETRKVLKELGFLLTEEPPSRMYFVQLNHLKPPFDNKALRQSVRNVFLNLLRAEFAAAGQPAPEPSFMPRGGVGYGRFVVPAAPAPLKTAAAEVEVVLFPLATYSFPEDGRMQAAAEKAFVKALELHGLKPRVSRYPEKAEATRRFVSGDYGAIMRGSGITINDPYSGLKMMFLSTISARIPDPSGRASEFIEKACETLDPAVRREMAARMNQAVYDDAALINFAHTSWIYIHRAGVDMSRFNLFMDPIEFRAVGWRPEGKNGRP